MKTKLLLSCILLSATLAAQSNPVVYREPGMDKIAARRQAYRSVGDTTLHFDLYLPSGLKAGQQAPLVVFVNGVGALNMPEWQVYKDWARLVANRGMAAVTFESRPAPFHPTLPNRSALADTEALLEFLRKNAAGLQIDPERIGIFCCSANVKTALPVVMQPERRYIRALAIYYGATGGVAYTRQDLPLLMARAGQDNAFQNEDMARFFAQALRLDAPAEFHNYPAGLHAFDIFNDTEESRAIIRRTLDFYEANLKKPARPVEFILTPGNLSDMIIAQQRTEEALQWYDRSAAQHRAFVAANPNRPYGSPYFGIVREENLNQIGYNLLQNKRIDEALRVFEANRAAWPDSPNAADALADAYEAKGDKSEAIRYAEQALQKLETAQNLPPQWADAIRRSATEKIQRLKKD